MYTGVVAGLAGKFQPSDSLPQSIFACLKVLQDLPIEDTELLVEDTKLPIEGPELPVEGEILT